MLSLKQGQLGAKITGLRPELVLATIIINDIFKSRNEDCAITCGLDGKHAVNSLHYTGGALDIRLPSTLALQGAILMDMKRTLDDEFDIALEGNHYHIELQPKKGINL